MIDRIYTSYALMKYLYSLQLVLTVIPTYIHVHQLNQLDSHLAVLVFLISSLHCHLYCNDNTTVHHLTKLINCLTLLCLQGSSSVNDTINDLHPFIKHQYSIDDDTLNGFMGVHLFEEGSVIMAIDGLPLPVPNSHVSLQRYGDHVAGIIDSLHNEDITVTRYTVHVHT